ncbi:hypothetical protein ABK040_008259 [Willaertia magna]
MVSSSSNNNQDNSNENNKTEQEEKLTSTQPSQKGIRKIRKARVQASKKKESNLQREEGGGEYNIWYHKYIGQQSQRKDIEPAETRCNIKEDAGWTVGCTLQDPFFCIFFSKGCCAEGPNCKYLHRIPTTVDVKRIPITKDCFGRAKFATDREDMAGVGSFNRDCKTLYISNLKYIQNLDYEEMLTRHFKEWGEIEYIRAYPERCYAFVKYKNRLNAEFAREAMLGQSLDNDEVIHIRWSAEDPNPTSSKQNETKKESKATSSSKSTVKDEGIKAIENKQVINSKVAEAYPNTDNQYKKVPVVQNIQQQQQQMTPEQQQQFSKYYSQFLNQFSKQLQGSSNNNK